VIPDTSPGHPVFLARLAANTLDRVMLAAAAGLVIEGLTSVGQFHLDGALIALDDSASAELQPQD
jgi:hypothetical protein